MIDIKDEKWNRYRTEKREAEINSALEIINSVMGRNDCLNFYDYEKALKSVNVLKSHIENILWHI